MFGKSTWAAAGRTAAATARVRTTAAAHPSAAAVERAGTAVMERPAGRTWAPNPYVAHPRPG